jgi:hypothetical protein
MAASIVSVIEAKLRKLIENYRELQERTETCIKENQELKKIHEEQLLKIQKLEEEIKIIKLSGTIESKEGKEEAKAKINELVREIDKCIGLLNR